MCLKSAPFIIVSLLFPVSIVYSAEPSGEIAVQAMNWWHIGLIMLIAGVLGGTVNFALLRTDKSNFRDWVWAVTIGIGASFLMPLFLNTLSSDLLINLMSENYHMSDAFVFSGFCLLGAIASRALIQTLSDKLIKEATQKADAAKEEAEETQRKLINLESQWDPWVDRYTEQNEGEVLVSVPKASLSDNQFDVLKALDHEEFSMRLVSGVAKDLGRDNQEVKNDLEALADMKLAFEVQGKKGLRWALSSEGHRLIQSEKVAQ